MSEIKLDADYADYLLTIANYNPFLDDKDFEPAVCATCTVNPLINNHPLEYTLLKTTTELIIKQSV